MVFLCQRSVPSALKFARNVLTEPGLCQLVTLPRPATSSQIELLDRKERFQELLRLKLTTKGSEQESQLP